MTVVAGSTQNSVLNGLLARHPYVRLEGESRPDFLDFKIGEWSRSIELAVPGAYILEIEDNNPLVCADECFSPDATTTLAHLALDPLFRADLVAADPVLLYSFDPVPFPPDTFVKPCELAVNRLDLGSVLALTALVEVPLLDDLQDLDAAFTEAYERSFLVQEAGEEWNREMVENQARACYHLRITPGQETNLLTINVMADQDGKCGAAQALHMLNVMAGFEETLGLDSLLRG